MRRIARLTVIFVVVCLALVVGNRYYSAAIDNSEVLVVDYLTLDLCDFYSFSGKYLGTYPWGFCHFLGDNTVLSGMENTTLRDLNNKILWQRPIFSDHHLSLHESRKIHLITMQKKIFENRLHILHRLLELDLSGQIIFKWKIEDHFKELASMIGPAKLSYKIPKSTSEKRFFYYYLNALIPVPEPIAKSIIASNSTLLLVGSWHTYGMFIVDTSDGRVVWAYSLHDKNMSGPHAPFFSKDGKVIFFINDLYIDDASKNISAIGILDVVKQELKTVPLETNSKKYYTVDRGSVTPASNGYIVAISRMGVVLKLNHEFMIESEIPLETRNRELYRVRTVQRHRVEHLLN